jgi:hypothetical protein
MNKLNLIIGIAVSGLVACSGGAGSSASASASAKAVLDGKVQGATNLKVTVPNTSLTSTTDASGNFALVGVPSGTAALRFSGSGVDTTLAITKLLAGEDRHLSVRISGNAAHEENEREDSRFVGVIDSITAPTVSVAGRVVTTTSATQFFSGGSTTTLDSFAVGNLVEVEGVPQADGSVVATKITMEDAGDNDDQGDDDGVGDRHGGDNDPRLEGALTAISGTSLTVNGITVTTSATTVFEAGEKHIALTDLVVGDRLEVRGTAQADGTFAASKVEVDADAGEQEDDHVVGAVTAVDPVAGSLTIGTSTIVVTPTTRFDDIASLAAISVGDMLDVEVDVAADGTLTAREIKALGDLPPPLQVEVRGAITAVDATTLTVDTKTFTVTSSTRMDHDGNTFTLASLKVGQIVDVRGAAQASGDLVATRVQLRN